MFVVSTIMKYLNNLICYCKDNRADIVQSAMQSIISTQTTKVNLAIFNNVGTTIINVNTSKT